MIVIKPVSGMKIYDPAHKDFLPEDGRQFSVLDAYWIRRRREGGIVVLKANEAKTTTKTKVTKSKSKE